MTLPSEVVALVERFHRSRDTRVTAQTPFRSQTDATDRQISDHGCRLYVPTRREIRTMKGATRCGGPQ